MPLVRITMTQGRTAQEKEDAAQEITRILTEKCRAHAEHVYVIFEDIPETDWTVGGVTVQERKRKRGES